MCFGRGPSKRKEISLARAYEHPPTERCSRGSRRGTMGAKKVSSEDGYLADMLGIKTAKDMYYQLKGMRKRQVHSQTTPTRIPRRHPPQHASSCVLMGGCESPAPCELRAPASASHLRCTPDQQRATVGVARRRFVCAAVPSSRQSRADCYIRADDLEIAHGRHELRKPSRRRSQVCHLCIVASTLPSY